MLGMILANTLMFIALACMIKIVLNELQTFIFVDLKKIKEDAK